MLHFFDGGAGRTVDQAGDVRVLLGALREEPISNPALAFLDVRFVCRTEPRRCERLVVCLS